MSDGYLRKHESGHQKRKKKEEKEKNLNKLQGSLLKFVNIHDHSTKTSDSNVESLNSHDAIESNLRLEKSNQSSYVKEPISTEPTEQHLKISDQENVPKKSEHFSQLQHLKKTSSETNSSQSTITCPEEQQHVEVLFPEFLTNFSTDPAEWVVTADLKHHIAKNTPSQDVNCDFKFTSRQIGDKIRLLTKDLFFRRLSNEEVILRDWLILSKSTGKLFCYVCKLFSSEVLQNSFQTGFDDWKNASSLIASHEQSKKHLTALGNLLDIQKSIRIDKIQLSIQEDNLKYWTKVLKRVVTVIQFLFERGLAFRGDNQIHNNPNNGNFLGCIDLLAKFDPFLEEHIRKYGNPGKGNVSYLSSTICEEFITLMGNKVLECILNEIKEAKYYGISIDSTPDVSHVDQLTLILRYVTKDGNVNERFLTFIPIEMHEAKYLVEKVMSIFGEFGLDIKNCRSQSYDNARNMSGTYSGVQSRIKDMNNLAAWVPCAIHSLNLVGVTAAESCLNAMKFFGLLQCLYKFFAATPRRWSAVSELSSTLKSLSITRWSTHYAAVKTLNENYQNIYKKLMNFAQYSVEKEDVKHEARALMDQLDSFEMALMTVIWEQVLNKFNIVTVALQEPGIELCTIVKLYDGLIQHFKNMRSEESFEELESKAKTLLPHGEYKSTRGRKRKRFFDEEKEEVSNLTPKQIFLSKTYYTILDQLISEMIKRREAYSILCDTFGFLVERSLSKIEIKLKAQNLVKIYSSDLEENFVNEFIIFSSIYKDKKSAQEMLKAQVEDRLVNSFPNVNIALRIYLSILGSNAEGERSFSRLKLIKNYLRSTMSQSRLALLTLMCVERDILKSIEFESIIKDFAQSKNRKMVIL